MVMMLSTMKKKMVMQQMLVMLKMTWRGHFTKPGRPYNPDPIADKLKNRDI